MSLYLSPCQSINSRAMWECCWLSLPMRSYRFSFSLKSSFPLSLSLSLSLSIRSCEGESLLMLVLATVIHTKDLAQSPSQSPLAKTTKPISSYLKMAIVLSTIDIPTTSISCCNFFLSLYTCRSLPLIYKNYLCLSLSLSHYLKVIIRGTRFHTGMGVYNSVGNFGKKSKYIL